MKKIIVIDNYDSFTYNLVQYLGELGEALIVHRNDKVTVDEVLAQRPDRIVISPGPGRPKDAGISNELVKTAYQDIPILGVCLGHQVIGEVFGAKVIHAPYLMHGKTSEVFHDGKGVYQNLPDPITATRYHSLVLEKESISSDFDITSVTKDDIVMGVRHKSAPLEGVQFHPESILTDLGKELLKNFVSQ